jgi:AcrR family transcriptional regulator
MNVRSYTEGKVDDTELTKGEQTRQEILDAAKVLFLAQGYTATSMRQIAGAVGITPGAIYNHFPGKDEIFTTVLEESAPYALLFEAWRRSDAATSEELVRQVLRRSLALMDSHEEYMRLVLIDAQEREGATLSAFLPQVLPRAHELYQRVAALDAGRGELRDIPFLVFVRVMVSLLVGFVMTGRMATSIPVFQRPETDWPQALADIFLFGVLDRGESEGE